MKQRVVNDQIWFLFPIQKQTTGAVCASHVVGLKQKANVHKIEEFESLNAHFKKVDGKKKAPYTPHSQVHLVMH